MVSHEQRVLITGAGRGIGREIALRMAADGARVVAADVVKAAAEAVATEIDPERKRAVPMHVDVTDRLQVQAMVARTAEIFGGIDVFFNNAGVIKVQPFLEIEEAEWDRVLDVNLKGVFLCGQAVGRHMVERERNGRMAKIINTASLASRVGVPDMAPYAASKAGVMSLTRSMALALAEHDITVNALAPGIVDTDMWVQIDGERAKASGMAPGEPLRQRVATIPLGRAATAVDIANVASFLASADSDYITGQTFNIDGGARPS